MIDIVIDTLLDAAKLLPFLFFTYLIMEFIEHRMGERSEAFIHKSGAFGPLWGSLFGCIPQCGFSAAASNFYAGRVITLGTLIAIYLSTSDEMLPIMITKAVPFPSILIILGIKAVYGIFIGFMIDLVYRKRENNNRIKEMCEHEKCHCERGIFYSAVIHTVEIVLYIIIISFVLNAVIYFVGEDNIKNIVLNIPVLGELLAGIVGIIPSCAASIIITELYLSGMLSFGAMMSGLFVGAGVGVLILFKVNKSLKENIIILSILYFTGVIGGILINLLGITV